VPVTLSQIYRRQRILDRVGLEDLLLRTAMVNYASTAKGG
jgi:hypothetical protein